MKVKEIIVSSRDGTGDEKSADMMVCDECGGECFFVYGVDNHLHLQCMECNTTYCRGQGEGCALAAGPAQSEPQCRVCGCTNSTPCQTSSGPCGWVERDLCSACAPGMALEDLRNEAETLNLSVEDLQSLAQLPVVALRLPAVESLQILSVIQLAARHPNLPANVRLTAHRVAGALQQYLGVTPNLQALCEAGWDPGHDVPAERRIIVP